MQGDDATVKRFLLQGVSPSCADYDKRSPLMVSAQEGRAVSGSVVSVTFHGIHGGAPHSLVAL